MKKKMERLSDDLFRSLTPTEKKWITGSAPHTQTANTIFETSVPSPDFSRDGDNE